MTSQTTVSPTTNYGMFDAAAYATCKFPPPGESRDLLSFTDLVLKGLAKFYKTTLSEVPNDSLRILDYGCGPSLPFSISATPKATEIVLAEYAEPNREFLKEWLEKRPSAYNWTPYFEHIVQTLEGNSKEEAVQREEEIHTKVKGVVHCDINQDQFIEEGYEKIYDVVMSFVCLESGCKDYDAYQSGVKKLVSMVKSGGYLLLCSVRRENTNDGYYFVDGTKFSSLVLKRDYIMETLQKNGLTVIDEGYMPTPSPGNTETFSNCEGYLFFAAKKNLRAV